MAGKASAVPGSASSGTWNDTPNSWNSPGRMRPPDQVTVSILSVICSPSASIGSSSWTIFTVRCQPSTGWKLAEITCSGNCMTIFVVSPASFSFGTRMSNLANPPASHSRGFNVTWAAATGVAMSRAASAAAIGAARIVIFIYSSSIGTEMVLVNRSNSPRRASIRSCQSPATERFAASTTKVRGSSPRLAL